MKSALVMLLLIIATATQPLLAVPASCTMGGERQKMTCASCCAANPCCAVVDRQQSTPLPAVQTASADVLAVFPLEPIRIEAPFIRQIRYSSSTFLQGVGHSPPPLVLNCIQLI